MVARSREFILRHAVGRSTASAPLGPGEYVFLLAGNTEAALPLRASFAISKQFAARRCSGRDYEISWANRRVVSDTELRLEHRFFGVIAIIFAVGANFRMSRKR
jgi:hypothetical protein